MIQIPAGVPGRIPLTSLVLRHKMAKNLQFLRMIFCVEPRNLSGKKTGKKGRGRETSGTKVTKAIRKGPVEKS